MAGGLPLRFPWYFAKAVYLQKLLAKARWGDDSPHADCTTTTSCYTLLCWGWSHMTSAKQKKQLQVVADWTKKLGSSIMTGQPFSKELFLKWKQIQPHEGGKTMLRKTYTLLKVERMVHLKPWWFPSKESPFLCPTPDLPVPHPLGIKLPLANMSSNWTPGS